MQKPAHRKVTYHAWGAPYPTHENLDYQVHRELDHVLNTDRRIVTDERHLMCTSVTMRRYFGAAPATRQLEPLPAGNSSPRKSARGPQTAASGFYADRSLGLARRAADFHMFSEHDERNSQLRYMPSARA